MNGYIWEQFICTTEVNETACKVHIKVELRHEHGIRKELPVIAFPLAHQRDDADNYHDTVIVFVVIVVGDDEDNDDDDDYRLFLSKYI